MIRGVGKSDTSPSGAGPGPPSRKLVRGIAYVANATHGRVGEAVNAHTCRTVSAAARPNGFRTGANGHRPRTLRTTTRLGSRRYVLARCRHRSWCRPRTYLDPVDRVHRRDRRARTHLPARDR